MAAGKTFRQRMHEARKEIRFLSPASSERHHGLRQIKVIINERALHISAFDTGLIQDNADRANTPRVMLG
jgi:hypothetical protein